jgi:hypothetical protein
MLRRRMTLRCLGHDITAADVTKKPLPEISALKILDIDFDVGALFAGERAYS